MKRYIRWALLVLGVLLLLIGIVFTTIWLHKDELIIRIKEELNTQIDADIEFESYRIKLFRNFPDATLGLFNLSLTGRDPFKEDTLILIENLEVEVDLWSLIRKPFLVESILVNNGIVKAKVLQDGRANWSIFPESEMDTLIESPIKREGELAYHIQKIAFNQCSILYDDAESIIHSSLKNVSLELNRQIGQEYWESMISVAAWNTNYDGIELMQNAKAKLDAELFFDADLFKLVFGRNNLRFNEMDFVLDGSVSMPDTSIITDISFASSSTSFKKFLSLIPLMYSNQYKDLETSGSINIAGAISGLYDSGNFPDSELKVDIDDGSFKYKSLPRKVTSIFMDVMLKNKGGEIDGTVVDLKTFKGILDEDPIELSLYLKDMESDPFIDLKADGKIDLKNWKELVPLKNTEELKGSLSTTLQVKGRVADINNKRFEKVVASGVLKGREINYLGDLFSKKLSIDVIDLEMNPQKIVIKSSKASIGQSDIAIKGNIEAFIPWFFDEGKLQADFDIFSDFLNVDEILEQEENEISSAGDSDPTKKPGGFAIPSSLALNLQVEIAKIRFNDMDMEKVNGRLYVNEGRASFSNFNANMLGGNVVFNGRYFSDSLRNDPFVDMDVKLSNVDLSQTVSTFNTVQKLAPIAQRCYGDYSANLKLKGNLKEGFSPDLSTFAGFLKFKTEKLQVEQIDVMKQVGRLTGSKYFDSPTLSKVNAYLEIVDGNIEVKPFKTFIKEAIITIGGKQGLNSDLDYYMQFDVPSKVLNSEKNEIAKILYGKIPVSGNTFEWPERIHFDALIGGTIQDPSLKVNVKDGLKSIGGEIIDQVKSKAEAEMEKARAALIQQAEKSAAALISLAEKQGDKLIDEAQKKATDLKNSANQQIDKLNLESAKKSDELIEKAGDNPLKKLAAQKAAELLKDEAKKKGDDLKKEAAKQANKIVLEAKDQKKKGIQKAKQEGDKLIEEARTKPLNL